MATSRGVGLYVAAEAHTCVWGRPYKPDATRRPVVYFTGGAGDDRNFLTAAGSGNHIPPVLSEAGVPLISAAFGGAEQWGNDTTITRIGQAWTQVKSQLVTKTDKFVGIGVSKGYAALDNYARANPNNVAALIGIVPAADVSDIFDNNRSGLAANINAAYGGNWAASKATHDPNLNRAGRLALGIPTLLIYGDNDTTVLAPNVVAYAAAIGAEARSVGAFGHLDSAPQIDPVEDILGFLDAYV